MASGKTGWRRSWRKFCLACRRGRALPLLLAGVAVAGAVLLLTWPAAPRDVVVAEGLSPEAGAAAQRALDRAGIAARYESGRLIVASADGVRARSLLTGGARTDTDEATPFEVLADQQALWQTQAQLTRQWLAAKMAELARLIRRFPAVADASVILEPGRQRTLSSPATPPRAAVVVSTVGGEAMPEMLVQAVADLVAGSVADMQASQVRIVDSVGRSYRAADEPLSPPGESLPPTGPAVAALPAANDAEAPNSQSVTPPPVAPGKRPAVPSKPPAGLAPLPVEADVLETPAPQTRPWRQVVAWSCLALAAVVAAGWLMLWRQQRRARQADRVGLAGDGLATDAERIEGDLDGVTPRESSALRDEGLAAASPLAGVSAEPLAAVLRDEAPSVLAGVLMALPVELSAGVLARLPARKRSAAARQMMRMSTPSQQVASAIARTLRERLAEGDREVPLRSISAVLDETGYGAASPGQSPAPVLPHGVAGAFEQLTRADSAALRRALADVNCDEVATSLWAAERPLRRRLLVCLPHRRARAVRQALKRPHPVRLGDVESAQAHIVSLVRQAQARAGQPREHHAAS